MQIHTSIESFDPSGQSPLVLGLGNFDGLHKGHRRLLEKVIREARSQKGKAAVLTFREHPQQVLHPLSKPPLLLTSLEQRMLLLEELGIDICFLLSFTKEFSQMEAGVFVEEVLWRRFRVKKVLLGYNAHFGHDRTGDVRLMKRLAGRFNFEFEEMAPVRAGEDFVSSSRIRSLIESGRLDEASECLGRSFNVLARVIRGEGRGKALGYPTANLEIGGRMMPPEGVYPVTARTVETMIPGGISEKSPQDFEIKDKGPWLQGVLNYGRRPTFKTNALEPCAEIFFLDFEGDLYGKKMDVVFFPRLREEMAFETREALREQIKKDVGNTRRYFDRVQKKRFTKTNK